MKEEKGGCATDVVSKIVCVRGGQSGTPALTLYSSQLDERIV